MRAPRVLSPHILALLAAIPQSDGDVHPIPRGIDPRRIWRALLCFCPEPAYPYWESFLEQYSAHIDELVHAARDICTTVFRCKPCPPIPVATTVLSIDGKVMAVGNDTPLPSTGSSAQSDSGDEIVAATPLTLQKRQQADLTKLVSALGDFFFFKTSARLK